MQGNRFLWPRTRRIYGEHHIPGRGKPVEINGLQILEIRVAAGPLPGKRTSRPASSWPAEVDIVVRTWVRNGGEE